MAEAKGLKVVGYFDCPGGGQVVVRDNVAYVGHVMPPDGTTIIDVAIRRKPRWLAEIQVPEGTLSHKVRVENGIMLVNREIFPIGRQDPNFRGGLEVFDVSTPSKPKHIATWAARGMHRFTFDGRYVYGSPEIDGYLGNVVGIIDFQNPDAAGDWSASGGCRANGPPAARRPTWKGTDHRCHHPMRLGNRLYVSYWHGGFVILDIDDISKPKFISGLDWSPPFPWPTHTALPVPFQVRGRRIMLVADEDVVRLGPGSPSFLWIVDITDETRPIPVRQLPGDRRRRQPEARLHRPASALRGNPQHRDPDRLVRARAAHRRHRQPARTARGCVVHAADVPEGAKRVQSNDVCFDDRGLIYLIDRTRGLHILERV